VVGICSEGCGAWTSGHGLASTCMYGGVRYGTARAGDVTVRICVPARHVSVQPRLTKFFSNFCN
jgi:hypothetical protein